MFEKKNNVMKRIKMTFFSLLFSISAECLIAQDHVTLKNHEVIEGNITENKIHFSLGEVPNISVDGKKYKVAKVKSYIKGNRYMVNIDNRYFLQAYIYGKINAMHIVEDAGHLSNRGEDKDYYMIQKGEDGELKMMNWRNLKEMISDNADAIEKFNSIEKGRRGSAWSAKEKRFLEAMKEIIDLYNK
jgi:hypothetical protein